VPLVSLFYELTSSLLSNDSLRLLTSLRVDDLANEPSAGFVVGVAREVPADGEFSSLKIEETVALGHVA
jgi:hypothetical protein